MQNVQTVVGKTYAVTTTVPCTVSKPDGSVIASCEPGKQAYFVAPCHVVVVSEDVAQLTQAYSSPPTPGGASQAEKAYMESKAAEAALSAAETRRTKEAMQTEQVAMRAHMEDAEHHVTAAEHLHLQRLIRDFPDVNPDAPSTPAEPPMPASALTHARMREHFARHAQPGASQAPSAVYVSRVPYARWDEASQSWVNNSSSVNEEVFGVLRKFMDNEGLRHTCSTDKLEGVDDYVGKLWPFYCCRGNYVTDEHGVKHVTAIQGQVVGGVSFDPAKPVCAFGPAFWFFCCLERWQNPDTGTWTTHDGTAEGVPLFQLWGISARAWEDLDEGRQAELAAHGVCPADVHLWPEATQWDAVESRAVARPYWCHSAYCGGCEVTENGKTTLVSKPNMPCYNNLCHNTVNALYGNRPGFGGGACVNGFGMLFDIVKNATKSSQGIHAGNTDNYCRSVRASLSTAVADYVFPIASQGNFRRGCTVYLGQEEVHSGGTATRRSLTQQIGRIQAIETRELLLEDGSTAESLCLVFDPATVVPFLVRTGADNAAAISATKALTDVGTYAACFATQGYALSGETDCVIGKHDGSCESNTDGRHAYRVQLTEYSTGVEIVVPDAILTNGDGSVDVEVDGVVSIPTKAQVVILHAGHGVTRRQSGTLQQFLASGYKPIAIPSATSGYILNVQLTPEGMVYPTASGGKGSGSWNGHGDNYNFNARTGEIRLGGSVSSEGGGGSACFAAIYPPSGLLTHAIGARD